MRGDGRLSGVLHVLLHMAQTARPMTSETMAQAMGTNPVVVRRIMAGLRDAGFVTSVKGHGGGWSITCNLADVSLRDVYMALGSPEIFAMNNRNDAPVCLMEQAVNAALDEAFLKAEAHLLEGMGSVSLLALDKDFSIRMAAFKEHQEATSAPRATGS